MIETYVPLYRKYRPQALGDLVGQEVVSTAVGNALALGKIAHAFLFCGPRGTGKTSSARILAKSLNCELGPTATPCQTCASCTSITTGNALDVTEIDAASNNGVESIRELTDKVQFAPIMGKYKIYIIDEVHMLSTSAFNALLKTLEEPPPNVIFIFATTEPHKVLPTIISRCQRFDFSRITRPQIEGRLRQVAGWESINVSDEAIALIARHARGGLRDALGLLDQVAVLGKSGSGEAIQPAQVRAFIGVLEEELLFQLTQGIVEKSPEMLLGQVRALQEKGVEPTQLVKELTQHFRNLLIAKACGPQASGEDFDIDPDLYPRLCQQVQGFETEELPQILSRLALLESQLRHSHQPQLWLEVALIDLCYRVEINLVKDLAERVAALEGGAPMAPRAAAPPRAPQATVPRPVAQAQAPIPQAAPVAPAAPQAPPMASAHEPIPSAPEPMQMAPEPVPQAPEPAPMMAATPEPQPVAIQAPAAPVDTSNMDHRTLWQHIMQVTQSLNMLVQMNLEPHFFIVEIKDNMLVLGYPKSKETLLSTHRNKPSKHEILEQATSTVMGRTMRVDFRLIDDAIPSAPIAAPPQMSSSPAPSAPAYAPEIPTQQQAAPAPEPEEAPVLVGAGNFGADPATLPPLENQLLSPKEYDIKQSQQDVQQLLHGKTID